MLLAPPCSQVSTGNPPGVRANGRGALPAGRATGQERGDGPLHHGPTDDHQGKTLLPTETTGKMTKRLPTFRSDRQEARFWDTHDSTDYLDQLEDDLETVFVRPESGLIEIGKETWQQLLREAKRRRTTPAALIRRWLKEKLSQTG